METNAPPINEAVNVLSKFAPESLDRLKVDLPAEIGPLLQPGGIAGKADDLIEARARVCLDALGAVMKRCERALQSAGKRLRLARRLRLVGDLAAVLGSSSVLVTSVVGTTAGVIISGAVALAGSLMSVIVQYFSKIEGAKSLSDIYIELGNLRFETQRIHGELAAFLQLTVGPQDRNPISKLIGQANALCLRVIQVSSSLLLDE